MRSLLGLSLLLCSFASAAFAADKNIGQIPFSRKGLNPALASSLGCTSFRWIAYEGVSDKAALQVPITLDGKEYSFQLDTGSPFTYTYGSFAKSRGWKTSDPNTLAIPDGVKGGARTVRVPNGAIGRVKLPALQLISIQEDETSEQHSGTLGLDVLNGYIVVLDFPGKHFCVMPRADFPADLGSKTAWIPAQIRNGSLRFDVTVGDEKLDLFYDSGSSWEGVDVDWDRWTKLTGASGERDAKLKVEVPSWGGNLKIFGAPSTGELRAGTLRFQHPMVMSSPSRPNEFKNSGLMEC